MKNFLKKILAKSAVILIFLFAIGVMKSTNIYAVGLNQQFKINNTILNFDKIVYVDGQNGSNETGNGSENAPYSTITKALGDCSTTNSAIFLKGTTEEKKINIGNKDISIIGDYLKYKSKITGKITSESPDKKACGSVNIYDIYLSNKSTGRWLETFFYIKNLNLYNCIFEENSSDSNVFVNNTNYYNCLIIKQGTIYDKINFINCAFCKNQVTYNDKFNITSNGWKNTGKGTNPDGTQANIGVYGGEFAWGYDNGTASIASLTIYKATDLLIVGQTDNIVATVAPDYATNKTLVWTSSDPSVATVDSNGKVTALKVGTAKITAATQDGSNLSASCIVNVRNPITRELLTINMLDSSQKKYDLSEDELNNFLIWYYDRANNQTNMPYYIFYVPATDSSPAKKEYILFNAIRNFEVQEYTK